MDYAKTKKAIAVVWAIAFLGITIKTVQEADMKTLLVPIEVTDAQYLALEKTAKHDAQDEATLVATKAVTAYADRALAEIERMTTDMHEIDKLLADGAKVMQKSKDLMQETEEVVSEIKSVNDPNMPRQNGFVGMETGDAEYLCLALLKESNTGKLTASGGVFYGPSGKETWYNLPMGGVIEVMRGLGYDTGHYPNWMREDGCKMFGPYVMVAADTNALPKGTVLETSLGAGMVVDHCPSGNIDIAVAW